MSDPKVQRYESSTSRYAYDPDRDGVVLLKRHPHGAWVRYSDYAALEDQLADLLCPIHQAYEYETTEGEPFCVGCRITALEKRCEVLEAENEELKRLLRQYDEWAGLTDRPHLIECASIRQDDGECDCGVGE